MMSLCVSLEDVMVSGNDWNPNTVEYKRVENHHLDENGELISTRLNILKPKLDVQMVI